MNPQNHILVVDADRHAHDAFGTTLDDLGAVHCTTGPLAALDAMEHAAPDVVLLDAATGDAGAFCRAVRSDARFGAVSIIVIGERAALAPAGVDEAVDFVDKPVDPLQLRTRVRTQLRIKSLVDALASSARSDALTGLPNRREFDEVVEREWRRAERGGDALSVLMIDIDRLDAYNDLYGRAAGDQCLASVATGLRALAMRRGDLVARYSDEKVVFVLPQTPRHGADFMAAQILATIDGLAIAHAASPTGKLTVSVGASSYDQRSACWVVPRANADFARHHERGRIVVDLVHAADRALGVAKLAGRARACALDVADLEEPTRIREIPPAPWRRATTVRIDRRESVAC